MAASLRKGLFLQLTKLSLRESHFFETQSHCVCIVPFKLKRNFEQDVQRRRKSSKVPEDQILPPFKVKRFFYNKLVNFVTTSEDKLEKRMPKTYEVYRTFRTGVSTFVAETKIYYGITSRLWSGESLSRFTRRELELYRRFSSDLPVMGMVIIIAFAPGGALIFPLAYMFPRVLLTSHFWTPKQKVEFRQNDMKSRLQHYPTVLDCMYKQGDAMPAGIHLKKAVNRLDSSVVLSKADLATLRPLFEGKPLGLDFLPLSHRWYLSKSLGLSFRRKKLVKEALLLRYIDVALRREGIHNLTDQDLDQACAWRGLNPQGIERDTKLAYLHNWTDVTEDVHDYNVSLLLHLPVLLSYCKPSNRRLMGDRHTTFRHKL